MAGSSAKISFLQLGMIMLLVNGLVSHVIINPMILGASGRDAWLVPLCTMAALVPWCLVLYAIMRNSGQQKLQPWLAGKIGPFFSWLLVLPVCLQIYFIGASTTFHTGAWTVASYLPETPQLVLVLILLAVCTFCAVSGIRAIAVGAGALLPFVVILGYFVSLSNTPNKELRLLKPFLEHGWGPVASGMLYAGGCFMELALLVAMQHHLKSKVKWWQLLILAAVLIHIMLGPIVGAITEFGPREAAKQMESPYEQWRLVKIGEYVEHVDFFSVYQWLSGATVRIGLSLFLLADLLPLRTPRSRRRFILLTSVSYLAFAMLPLSRKTFYLGLRYYFLGSLLLIGLIVLIWLAVSVAKPAKERAA